MDIDSQTPVNGNGHRFTDSDSQTSVNRLRFTNSGKWLNQRTPDHRLWFTDFDINEMVFIKIFGIFFEKYHT